MRIRPNPKMGVQSKLRKRRRGKCGPRGSAFRSVIRARYDDWSDELIYVHATKGERRRLFTEELFLGLMHGREAEA